MASQPGCSHCVTESFRFQCSFRMEATAACDDALHVRDDVVLELPEDARDDHEHADGDDDNVDEDWQQDGTAGQEMDEEQEASEDEYEAEEDAFGVTSSKCEHD